MLPFQKIVAAWNIGKPGRKTEAKGKDNQIYLIINPLFSSDFFKSAMQYDRASHINGKGCHIGFQIWHLLLIGVGESRDQG